MRYIKFLLILIIFGNCTGQAKKKNTDLPNIVLIVADDLGYGDLGCYGSRDISSPHIDKLARHGVRFTNFYSNGPECTPTRAALLTGRYQQRAGGLECALGAGNVARYDEAEWLWKKKELGLPPQTNVLAPLLKKKGYRTAMFGKWHLGYEKKFRPDKQGFDYSFGNIGYGGDYFYHTEQAPLNLDDFSGAHNLAINGNEVFRDGRYMTELIAEEAVNWIGEQENGEPFFIYLPFTSPHTPYQGPEDDTGRPLEADQWNVGTREKYVEMVEFLDKGIGQILAKLDARGMMNNTVIFFISDNGGARIADNGILRGNKGQVYEGGIRVPFIIKWPGKIEANQVSEQVSIGFDISRSILELTGVETSDFQLDGYNILDHITEKKADFNRTLFWRVKRGERVRKAVRDGEFKYIVEYNEGRIDNENLFNLKLDPSELNDLSGENPPLLQTIRKKLGEWEKDVESPRLKDFKSGEN